MSAQINLTTFCFMFVIIMYVHIIRHLSLYVYFVNLRVSSFASLQPGLWHYCMQVFMSCLNVIKSLNGWHYKLYCSQWEISYRRKAEYLLPRKVVKSVTLQKSQYARHVSLMTLQV